MAFIAPLIASAGTAISSIGLGTAISAAGSIFSTVSAVGAANYQAGVAKNNAIIAAKNAEIASEKSQQQQLISDQQARALTGEQEAVQSGSGLTGESQLRVRKSATELAQTDALNIRQAGSLEIQNFLQQSENYKAEAANAGKQAIAAMVGGTLDLAGTLVGGAKTTDSPFAQKKSGLNNDPWVTPKGTSLRNVYAGS